MWLFYLFHIPTDMEQDVLEKSLWLPTTGSVELGWLTMPKLEAGHLSHIYAWHFTLKNLNKKERYKIWTSAELPPSTTFLSLPTFHYFFDKIPTFPYFISTFLAHSKKIYTCCNIVPSPFVGWQWQCSHLKTGCHLSAKVYVSDVVV